VITITPDPIAFQIGPIAVGWYGIGYVLALGAMIAVTQVEAARRGIDRRHVLNAILLVAILALAGARLYHVIDQFDACGPGGPCYRERLLAIVLPPYSGLGLYGGIAGALLGIVIYARRNGLPLWRTIDAVVPGTLLAQGIARWGNFFNQELYGPPTSLPWGIAIDCEHRLAQYPCTAFPFESTGFHPLFFYESALDITGALVALWLSRRFASRLRDGDLGSFWLIWYGSVRTVLETFREGYNWRLFDVIPMATAIGVAAVVIGVVLVVLRHRRPRVPDAEPVPGDRSEASDRQTPGTPLETGTDPL
jgi:phosphatidylglycerol---prolipoprotein diacylglyceryl transferase